MTESLFYVLAQQQREAPEGINYLRSMTAIGPCGTWDLSKAQRFATEEEARRHPATSFALTFYKPCPVVGDIVGRPLEWLDAEMNAARAAIERESPDDGLQVFA